MRTRQNGNYQLVVPTVPISTMTKTKRNRVLFMYLIGNIEIIVFSDRISSVMKFIIVMLMKFFRC